MDLPDGWKREKTEYGHNTEAIFRPLSMGGGIVSVDYDRRNFAGGLGTTGSAARGED